MGGTDSLAQTNALQATAVIIVLAVIVFLGWYLTRNKITKFEIISAPPAATEFDIAKLYSKIPGATSQAIQCWGVLISAMNAPEWPDNAPAAITKIKEIVNNDDSHLPIQPPA